MESLDLDAVKAHGGTLVYEKQIRKMVKKGKTKKVVGSAAVAAARGEAEDGSGEKFAANGMGLGPLPAVAAGASGEEITSAEATGPPACSVLDDVAPQPAAVAPSSDGGPTGGEFATAALTLEQEGAATQARAREARLKAAAARQDGGDAQRTSGRVLPGAAAPGAGAVVRTGLGVGHGVFDAPYKPRAEDAPFVRFGRGYSDKTRWTEKEAQGWQADLTKHVDGWTAMNRTVRLFKAVWQGQELK